MEPLLRQSCSQIVYIFRRTEFCRTRSQEVRAGKGHRPSWAHSSTCMRVSEDLLGGSGLWIYLGKYRGIGHPEIPLPGTGKRNAATVGFVHSGFCSPSPTQVTTILLLRPRPQSFPLPQSLPGAKCPEYTFYSGHHSATHKHFDSQPRHPNSVRARRGRRMGIHRLGSSQAPWA